MHCYLCAYIAQGFGSPKQSNVYAKPTKNVNTLNASVLVTPVITLQGNKIWHKVSLSFFQKKRREKGNLGHRNADHRDRLIFLDLGGGSGRFVAVPERMGRNKNTRKVPTKRYRPQTSSASTG